MIRMELSMVIIFLKDNNGDIILSYEYVLDKAINYCNNGEYSMLLTKFLTSYNTSTT